MTAPEWFRYRLPEVAGGHLVDLVDGGLPLPVGMVWVEVRAPGGTWRCAVSESDLVRTFTIAELNEVLYENIASRDETGENG